MSILFASENAPLFKMQFLALRCWVKSRKCNRWNAKA